MSRFRFMKFCILAIGLLVVGHVLSTPAVAASPISIGIVEDVTGYNADAGRAERDGAILCIEEWNARGGINGRKIEYVFRDNGVTPPRRLRSLKSL